MTFDPKKWIQEAWNAENSKSISLAGEEIIIRRLTGTQWEHYVRAVNGKSDDSSVVVMLQHGLVKAFGHYTYEEMAKFYDACPVRADKIDKTHQLIVLSRQIAKGPSSIIQSNIIQGYNFEKDYVRNAVDTGNAGLNFAG